MVSINSFLLKLVFWSLVVSLASAGRAEMPSADVPDPDIDPCRYFTLDEERVDFFIEMRLEQKQVPLSVPKIFLEDRWDYVNGASHRSQLFRVTIDTFTPLTRRQASQQNQLGSKNRMIFLAGDRVDMTSIATNTMLFADPGPHDRTFETYALESAAYDLMRAIPKGNEPQRDVYVLIDENGTPETVIACSKHGLVKFPGCEHHFRASGIDVLANYPITTLAHWRTIENNIAQFFSCAVESYNTEDI